MFNPTAPLTLIDRLSEFLSPRLWLGWAAGGALWLAWLISLVLGGGLYDRFGQLVCTDHLAFYSAARMIRDGRASEIYDNSAIAAKQIELVGERWNGRYEAFRNPPFYALLYAPTVGFSYAASSAIWAAISVLALVLGIHWLGASRPWRTCLWAFCFYPVFASISYGQNSPLSVAVLALTYRLLKTEHRFLAGLIAGLLVFKPTLLLGLSVWCLLDIRRLWPCLLGACTTVFVLTGVSYLIVPEAWSAFFVSLKENVAFDQMDWWKNLTPRAFWRLLLGDSPAIGPLAILSATMGIVWFVWVWRTCRNHLPSAFGATVVLTLWVSPHAMVYEWALLVIPAILWWESSKNELRPRWTILFVFVGILALVGPPLSQAQLAVWPYAIHVSVIGFGWAGWRAGKWLIQSNRTA